MRSAREIQRSVQQKLKERMEEEESMRKSILDHEAHEKLVASNRRKTPSPEPEDAKSSPVGGGSKSPESAKEIES